MSDDEIDPISPSSANVAPMRKADYFSTPMPPRPQEPPPKREHKGFAELASEMDIPEHMLTPPVQRALLSIIDEVERLRWRLRQAERRMEYLETVADMDGHLPILNRRAFERELGGLINRSNQKGVTGALVYLYLDSYDRIRKEHGMLVAEKALTHLAMTVRNSVRSSDIVGHVGGASVAVALAMASAEGGVTLSWDMVRKVRQVPFMWEGEALPLTISVGVHEFADNETADGVIAAADKSKHRSTVSIGGEEDE